MNLKTFDHATTRKYKRYPVIGITQHDGLINIGKSASHTIGIKDMDQVKFHQDNEIPENWYIEVVQSGGIIVRAKDGGHRLQSALLVREIGLSLGLRTNFQMKVAMVPTIVDGRKLYGLFFNRYKD